MYIIYEENENEKKNKSIIVGKITGNSEDVKPIFFQKQIHSKRKNTKKLNKFNKK